jgi:hypothetical protein
MTMGKEPQKRERRKAFDRKVRKEKPTKDAKGNLTSEPAMGLRQLDPQRHAS